MSLTIGSTFAGIGGLEMGLEAATGARVAWQIEIEDYPRQVLAKHWPHADRSITDVREAPGHLPPVDILCGGFPCQDLSVAGRGAGLAGEKSGLWFELLRLIRALRPRIVVLENVPALLTRGMGVVLGGLAASGYDAEWSVLSAASVGAPHRRERLFIIAYLPHSDGGRRQALQPALANPNGQKELQPGELLGEERRRARGRRVEGRTTPDARRERREERDPVAESGGPQVSRIGGPCWWATEPGVGRVAHGIPNRAHRLRALGNAVVPQCAYQVGLRVRDILGEPHPATGGD